MIHKSLILSFLSVLFISAFFSSCGKDSYVEDVDTTRGIWGKVLLYDEKGNLESNSSDVTIRVHCIDTLSESEQGATIWDTTYYITADARGNWELYKPEGGWYFIDFTKEEYCKNVIYAYQYDTSSADTLETVYLAKPTKGNIEIDSVVLNDNVLSIYRTLYFSASYSSYALSTWYFFGTSADVSPSNYAYAYVSGSASSKGEKEQKSVIYKPIDKLLENGLAEGSTVYMRAYCDNARAISYQVGEDSWVFPNIDTLAGSAVLQFEIPESDE